LFGIFERGVKVYTEIVLNCDKTKLQGIIGGQVDPDSVMNSEGCRGYNGLVDLGHKKHYRVNHNKDEFFKGRSHINGIKSFWPYAEGRMMKFHGIAESTYYLHLKECEFQLINEMRISTYNFKKVQKSVAILVNIQLYYCFKH
jgi:transposase